MYLMSRFLMMAAQTIAFPTILVTISMNVNVVMTTSADSDMTEGCQLALARYFSLGVNKTKYELICT